MNTIALAENGVLPTWLVRFGIRSLVRKRLRDESESYQEKKSRLINQLRDSVIAIETDAANEQHYEVPADFYKIALGDRLKYSCCYWPAEVENLDQAELASLKQIAERAQLEDGQRLLELGCGWGSFTLWAAETFPNSEIVGVSNSKGQKAHIEGEARLRGLTNIRIITADMNHFQTDERFDRIVSVEMFEHMRNYPQLFSRIHDWLDDDGKLFVHVFSHRQVAYFFEDQDDDDWMARHFFTGGIMPSHDLLPQVCAPFALENSWQLDGTHYQKTADAWLENMDRNTKAIRAVMSSTYGAGDADVWRQRWRMFMMACSELFGFKDGKEWGVSHYLFKK
ncbi:cyclopropane-fatty-acyl-phospholipid synthase family protein [Pelagicoccus sp. SDUM812003]|uniref:SAM-dependent methyltransferase n=1 Tax=Pelagicoccus sp. SDUM812003 TaxID=3041267 RepID=UPI00280E0B6A|nr:cyclopropane-fatty-acyl-phospholipid synthase family protein [Pelagicoccus sp. SDUM812003]MDQ8201888.1 cyclopropane-fatty-acyl-phospholipid synthase [Pelagicoccus sp. SDUM812003]